MKSRFVSTERLIKKRIMATTLRRTKEQVAAARLEKQYERADKRRAAFVLAVISANKFLRETKYHKNNHWSWAAWDSWAAQGKAGGCGCGAPHYNGSLRNSRAKTRKGSKPEKYGVDISRNLCSQCVNEIEKIIGSQFKKY